ncbi:Methyl-CpG-binding domain protein 4 [Ancistrocladus abbreviatus]
MVKCVCAAEYCVRDCATKDRGERERERLQIETRKMKNKEESPKTAEKSKPRGSVDVYAAQCGKCLKWRTIDSLEEYEEMRSRFTEDPFFCSKKPNVTCDDPADIEYDATRTWVIDKPNIPKTPAGFRRELILRRDFSKLDAHYVTPTGKRVRTRTEVAAYVKENPQYKDVNVDDFNFTVPKVMEDTIPESISGSLKKKVKKKMENQMENAA